MIVVVISAETLVAFNSTARRHIMEGTVNRP
jgi:hypothetical protein